jgi:hypothetical protein
VIVTSMAVFAAIGWAIGLGIGLCCPDYYRDVFEGGRSPEFNPVAVGVGQGLTQGAAGGAALGLGLVAILAWHEARGARLAIQKIKDAEL